MNEQSRDHQVGRPAVHGPNQPAELHFGDYELDTFKGIFSTRAIIQQKKDTGSDLHAEKKQGHSAKVIPDRVPMKRNLLLAHEMGD